jgi:hypothetical protein
VDARHLKKGGTYQRLWKLERYKFIENEKINYPVSVLCRVMKVNRSCYYLYAGRQTFRQSRCATAVKECFFENRRRLRFAKNCGTAQTWTRHRAKGNAA